MGVKKPKSTEIILCVSIFVRIFTVLILGQIDTKIKVNGYTEKGEGTPVKIVLQPMKGRPFTEQSLFIWVENLLNWATHKGKNLYPGVGALFFSL